MGENVECLSHHGIRRITRSKPVNRKLPAVSDFVGDFLNESFLQIRRFHHGATLSRRTRHFRRAIRPWKGCPNRAGMQQATIAITGTSRPSGWPRPQVAAVPDGVHPPTHRDAHPAGAPDVENGSRIGTSVSSPVRRERKQPGGSTTWARGSPFHRGCCLVTDPHHVPQPYLWPIQGILICSSGMTEPPVNLDTEPAEDADPMQPPGTFTQDGTTYGPEASFTSVLGAVRDRGRSLPKWATAFGLGHLWSFVKENAAWCIAIVAAFLVVVKVLAAANGDVNVAVVVVSSSTSTSVLFGIAVQAVGAILTGSPLFSIVIASNLLSRRIRERALTPFDSTGSMTKPPFWSPAISWSFALVLSLFSFSFFFAYWGYFIGAVAVGVLLIGLDVWIFRGWKKIAGAFFESDQPNSNKLAGWKALISTPISFEPYVLGLVIALLILGFTSTMWLPAQRFATKTEGTIVGYQLSDKGGATTILRDSPRLPVVLKDSNLRMSTYCEISKLTSTPSAFQLLLDDAAPQLPLCNPLKSKPESPHNESKSSVVGSARGGDGA
jgi:hypothetical protein